MPFAPVTSSPSRPSPPPLVASSPATPPPVAVAPSQPRGPNACASDADCTVSTFPGCCMCPQCSEAAPFAIATRRLEAQLEHCKIIDCYRDPACDLGGKCPPVEDPKHFRARCVEGSCELSRR